MKSTSGKKLYYFTASYPWGVGQTWKSNELGHLRDYFDQITVVPYCYEGNFDSPKPLPLGVSSVPPLFLEGAPKIDLGSAVRIVERHAGHYVTELVRKRPFSSRARLGAWLGASIQTSRLLRHPVIRQIMNSADSDTALCFFWGRGACDFLPFVDKRRFRSVVVRFHRYDLFEDENAGYIPYRRQLLESISIAAPSSEKGCQHLRNLYPDVSTPIRLARLGVPRLPELAMSTDGVLRILSCSYVVPRKRVGLIADALGEVRFPVHWTHVGDGSQMSELRSKIATLPPNVETHFPGAIATDKLFAFYEQRPIDVFVNVSTSEGIAMTIIESLSAGVPVLATDVGGSTEVVDSSVGGILPSDVSPRQLAAELERFHALSHAEKCMRREAAVRRHRERCDVEALTRRLADMLLDPVGHGPPMRLGRRVLYVTADGILQPLGYSQVVRVVEGLARKGFAYDIASLEPSKDLARVDARKALEARLSACGVRWFAEPWDGAGGGRAAASNLARLISLSLRRAASGDYALLHARSYLAALSASAARAAHRVPFLFDARGYWVDERVEEGRWFTAPAALRAARLVEHGLFRSAAAVVTLTELQADDVRGGAFGPQRGRPVTAIPTCADFDDFQLRRSESLRFVPPEPLAKLHGRLVLGFVGSLNRSYLSEHSARLARLVLERRPDAFVLALSSQQVEYSALFARHGIAPERRLIQGVEHHAMPEWLTLIGWGLLLLDSPRAKRGSMPTKLAEFFAAGVRPLQHGCNTEVSDWVRRAGSGHVLPDVTEPELTRAAQIVCATGRDDVGILRTARNRAEPHFALVAGIRRYAEILVRAAPQLAP